MESKRQNRRAERLLRFLSLDVTPLRASRDYRLLFTGQFVSRFGSAISYVVLPWQMYQLTRSTFAVGMLGVAEFVPMFLMSFVGGALADYVDRRRLIIWAELGLTACSGVLVANSLLTAPHPSILFLTSAMIAAILGIHRPALESLTPKLVDAEHLPALSALSALGYSFGFIIGPGIAGIIVATMGAAFAFSIDAATYVFSLLMLLRMRSVPVPPGAERPSLSAVADGFRYAASRRELLGTYLIDINAMFFGMPMALFPAIAEKFGPGSVGMLYAAPTVGVFIFNITSGWTKRIHKHGLAVVIAASIWGIGIVGFGFANRLWLALFWLVLAGGADLISGLFRVTIWNQTIPDHLRGRLAAIELISYTTGPYLGNAEAGLVASLAGLRFSIVSGGVMCVAGSVILGLCLPSFVRYDDRAGLARKKAEEEQRAAEIAAAD